MVEFASGEGMTSSDYTSGLGDEVDEVIFVEEPHGEGRDHVEISPVDEHSSSTSTISTSAIRHSQPVSTTSPRRPWFQSRTPGHVFIERTSSQSTSMTVVSSDNESARVKSKDEGDWGTTPRYMALALNVALLAGIVFVVAVFFVVLVSFVVHRRRQLRQRDIAATPTLTTAAVVSRPRIKPAYTGFSVSPNHTPTSQPAIDKPRLFVSVSRVGDPKEWFV